MKVGDLNLESVLYHQGVDTKLRQYLDWLWKAIVQDNAYKSFLVPCPYLTFSVKTSL